MDTFVVDSETDVAINLLTNHVIYNVSEKKPFFSTSLVISIEHGPKTMGQEYFDLLMTIGFYLGTEFNRFYEAAKKILNNNSKMIADHEVKRLQPMDMAYKAVIGEARVKLGVEILAKLMPSMLKSVPRLGELIKALSWTPPTKDVPHCVIEFENIEEIFLKYYGKNDTNQLQNDMIKALDSRGFVQDFWGRRLLSENVNKETRAKLFKHIMDMNTSGYVKVAAYQLYKLLEPHNIGVHIDNDKIVVERASADVMLKPDNIFTEREQGYLDFITNINDWLPDRIRTTVQYHV